MRLSLSAFPLLLAGALCLALAACGRDQDAPPPAAEQGASEAAASVDAGAAADEPDARTPSLQDELVLLTNEPFWQVRTDGPKLALSGIEGQRELDVVSSAVADGARTVVANDASGKVEIRVTDEPCQDSMAGASFPFTGTLVIDGGAPIQGCARPAWMPPPGEPG